MPGCVAVPQQGLFTSDVVRFLDCEAQTLGEQGYRALAAPGSPVALALTAMLTAFVALIGYRLLLGRLPGVRDGVVAMVKIGVVLAFATNWSAYRTVVYDVTLRAPAELGALVGTAADVPGGGGGLFARLDDADQAFDALAIANAAPRPAADAQAAPVPAAPPLFAGFDTFAIGAARAAFLAGAIGAVGFARLGAGLLLALGPLFVAFLLFDGTRGLFEGWARALIGTALSAFASALLLGIELAMLEPWLAALVTARQGNDPIAGAPVQLLAAVTVFALLLVAMTMLMVRVGMGLRLPDARGWGWLPVAGGGVEPAAGVAAARIGREPGSDGGHRSRARQIADAVAISQRRDAGGAAAAAATATVAARQAGPAAQARDAILLAAPTPIGQAGRRRPGTRVSGSAGRRDSRR